MVQCEAIASRRNVYIATCWDDTFHEIFKGLQDETFLQSVCETWPTLLKLITNGLEDKYDEGALIVLEDEDTKQDKWFLVTVRERVNFKKLKKLFNDDVLAGIKLVLGKSMELLRELHERKPKSHLAKEIGLGLLKGAGFAAKAILIAMAREWAGDVADVILGKSRA